MKLNNMDLIAIQECLDSYKKLVEWIPAIDSLEEDMKADRLEVISHLMKVCEDSINE